MVSVKLEDGTLATCEHDALQRWVRYFPKFYSAVVTRDPATVVRDPINTPCVSGTLHCKTIVQAFTVGQLVDVWRAGGPQHVNNSFVEGIRR